MPGEKSLSNKIVVLSVEVARFEKVPEEEMVEGALDVVT